MEIWQYDGCGQAALVRSGEVSASEVLEAALARTAIAQKLNVFAWPLFDEALGAVAQARPGLFQGVPFALKDLGATQVGQPQTMGNRALRDLRHRSAIDSTLGARFRAAGFVTIGKTNVPEFGLQSTTQPLAFGPTRNPWDALRSVSGSSGGSAAAVAAGIVPIAHGNDGAGSIRMPAAWCGLVGLKPSRGRIPNAPDFATSRMDVEFAVCRSVRDAAAMLDAVAGHAPGDLFHAPEPPTHYREVVSNQPGPLRVALCSAVPGLDVDQACVDAVQETGRLLEALGHRVVDDAVPKAFAARGDDPMISMLALVATVRHTVASLGDLLGREAGLDDVEPFTWAIADAPLPTSAVDLLQANAVTQSWAVDACRWWDEAGIDVLVTPTVSELPCLLSEMDAELIDPTSLGMKVAGHCAFTEPFNVTGEPAISLPLHWTSSGLPVGIQLVARFGREDVLLQLAAQLEQARPWSERWMDMASRLAVQ